MLGLSTQVPAQTVYLTDGRSKTVKDGKQIIRLKHAAPSKMVFADSPKATVMQALRSVGQENISDRVVKQIARAVSQDAKDDLARFSPTAPDWTRPIMKRIASE